MGDQDHPNLIFCKNFYHVFFLKQDKPRSSPLNILGSPPSERQRLAKRIRED